VQPGCGTLPDSCRIFPQAGSASGGCGPNGANYFICVQRWRTSRRAWWDMSAKDEGEKLIASNRKAFHDYFILEKLEAGISLFGTEVKSSREGRVNLRDSYAAVKNGEAFLLNCHISPYSHGNRENHEPTRIRKLLLHRKEIRKLIGKTNEKGLTLVPLRVYLKRGRIKVELGVARGKKQYDKRETERRKETERETRAAIKSRR
jgi:SsrA-binding protein